MLQEIIFGFLLDFVFLFDNPSKKVVKVKRKQRHTTNEKTNMYLNVFNNIFLDVTILIKIYLNTYLFSIYLCSILYTYLFSFAVWRWFFFTLVSHTSTPVSLFCCIDLDPAAVFVPSSTQTNLWPLFGKFETVLFVSIAYYKANSTI